MRPCEPAWVAGRESLSRPATIRSDQLTVTFIVRTLSSPIVWTPFM